MAPNFDASKPLARAFLNFRGLTVVGLVSILAVAASAQPFFQKTSGPGGGRLADLVRQVDGDLFVTARSSSGFGPIYRSTNDGWTWTPVGHSADQLAALANGDLYTLGAVTARSRNDGASWTTLTLARPTYAIVAISSGRLLAGTDQGVYRSDDDGATWHPSGLASTVVNRLLVGADGFVYGAAGVDFVRSVDGGENWPVLTTFPTRITGLAPRLEGGWWVGTYQFPYVPSPPGGVYRYDGVTPPELVASGFWSVYDIWVHPDGRLFVYDTGYCEMVYGALSSATDPEEEASWRFVSGPSAAVVFGDKGEMFIASTGDCGRGSAGRGVLWAAGPEAPLQPRNRGLAHALSTVLAVAPGIVYAQADYDLAWSTDHGLSWNSGGPIDPGVYNVDIAAHPSGDVFAAARWVSKAANSAPRSRTSGAGGFSRTRDQGATWTAMEPDYGAENGVVVTAGGSVLILPALRSTDRGDSWQPSTGGGIFYLFAPGPVHRVFAAGFDGTYLSEDDGASWTLIGATRTTRVGGAAAAARDEKSVVVDTEVGLLRIVETSPGVWSEVSVPALSGSIYAMASDYEGTLYASTEAGVSRLRSGASTWQPISDIPMAALVFDDSGYLYGGTGGEGVMRSVLPLRETTDALPATLGIMAWQAGPTPFTTNTAFALELGKSERVSLQVFDVRGRVVSTLWEKAELPQGRSVVTWRPDSQLPSGGYFYRLMVGSSVRAGRVTLVR